MRMVAHISIHVRPWPSIIYVYERPGSFTHGKLHLAARRKHLFEVRNEIDFSPGRSSSLAVRLHKALPYPWHLAITRVVLGP
jgi:hypothetical protein